jgi:hypothetical protein
MLLREKTTEARVDKNGFLYVPESMSLLEIIRIVHETFYFLPDQERLEKIVIRGPRYRAEPDDALIIGQRPTVHFRTGAKECRVDAYTSVQQLVDTARTIPGCDLAQIKIFVPIDSPNQLTLYRVS